MFFHHLQELIHPYLECGSTEETVNYNFSSLLPPLDDFDGLDIY